VKISKINCKSVINADFFCVNCSSLQSVDFSGWNTENLTDAYAFLYLCSSLQSVDFSGWNTENLTNMGYFFYNMDKIKHIDLSMFNIKNVTSLDNAFGLCSSLTDLNPPYNWKQSNISFVYSAKLSPISIHLLISRAMDVVDGATARTLTLHATAKTNWQNSEYYEQDLAVLSTKGITIA
jgi:surface protein